MKERRKTQMSISAMPSFVSYTLNPELNTFRGNAETPARAAELVAWVCEQSPQIASGGLFRKEQVMHLLAPFGVGSWTPEVQAAEMAAFKAKLLRAAEAPSGKGVKLDRPSFEDVKKRHMYAVFGLLESARAQGLLAQYVAGSGDGIAVFRLLEHVPVGERPHINMFGAPELI